MSVYPTPRLLGAAISLLCALVTAGPAGAETLSAVFAEQFDAALIRPLGAIAGPGQTVSGARQERAGKPGILDLTGAVVCNGATAPGAKAVRGEDDIVAEGAFTISGDASAATELEVLLGLSRADLAAVDAIRYNISAGIDSPQSKVIAGMSLEANVTCGAGAKDTKIVTSVVSGDLALTVYLKRETPLGTAAVIAQRVKVALDPAGRRFGLELAGTTFTVKSRQRLVIGANVEPVSSFRK